MWRRVVQSKMVWDAVERDATIFAHACRKEAIRSPMLLYFGFIVRPTVALCQSIALQTFIGFVNKSKQLQQLRCWALPVVKGDLPCAHACDYITHTCVCRLKTAWFQTSASVPCLLLVVLGLQLEQTRGVGTYHAHIHSTCVFVLIRAVCNLAMLHLVLNFLY